jgi:hypothetical protein
VGFSSSCIPFEHHRCTGVLIVRSLFLYILYFCIEDSGQREEKVEGGREGGVAALVGQSIKCLNGNQQHEFHKYCLFATGWNLASCITPQESR